MKLSPNVINDSNVRVTDLCLQNEMIIFELFFDHF